MNEEAEIITEKALNEAHERNSVETNPIDIDAHLNSPRSHTEAKEKEDPNDKVLLRVTEISNKLTPF